MNTEPSSAKATTPTTFQSMAPAIQATMQMSGIFSL